MMGLTGDALSDAAWAKLAPHLPGKAGDVGCTAADNRLFLNAGLWVLRHGGTWRVLPARFGKHDSVRKRAQRWARKGTWQHLFAAVRGTALEAVLLDSTIVRAHQRAAGQVKKNAPATRRSAVAAAG
jgi:transposase